MKIKLFNIISLFLLLTMVCFPQRNKSIRYSIYYSNSNDFPEMLTNNTLVVFAGTTDDGIDDDWVDWSEGSVNSLLEATTISHSGSAAKFTNQATQSYVNASLQYSNITVTPNTNYRLTYWTRGDGTNSAAHRVYNNTGSANIVANSENNSGISGTTYTLKTVDFTTPAGCIKITIYFYMDGTNGSVVYVDDISLKKR